jgi:hypothetical protein
MSFIKLMSLHNSAKVQFFKIPSNIFNINIVAQYLKIKKRPETAACFSLFRYICTYI